MDGRWRSQFAAQCENPREYQSCYVTSNGLRDTSELEDLFNIDDYYPSIHYPLLVHIHLLQFALPSHLIHYAQNPWLLINISVNLQNRSPRSSDK